VYVDGTAYFERLHRLPAALARRGVAIRGLLWRSHPALVRFNQDANRVLSTVVNRAGGQLVADQRVRRFGSHHQKLLVVHLPNRSGRCIAFVGGIDLSRGRRDGPDHLGDADPVRIDPRYSRRPPWHDLQLELHGPAVLDVDLTFRERWEDRTPRDHRNPLRAMWRRLSHEPRRLGLLQRRLPPPEAGSHAVQVLRTYPAHRRAIPFAPDGERSIARAYLKALGRARSLVYIKDQYLWGTPIYVHAKAVVIDDVWAMVGSANLNRRSWTHDSEVACAVLDQRRDPRQPTDPGGLGDGARVFARQLRLRLWREHLGLGNDADDTRLLDPVAGFEALAGDRGQAPGLA
jgi:phosphatidylserine/phosphatidylglycerophosphate/cardiolipin synthase-like enzyme